MATLLDRSAVERLASSIRTNVDGDLSKYDWKIGKVALSEKASFVPSGTHAEINIALRAYLHDEWHATPSDKRFDQALWIVKRWGRINKNTRDTLNRYVANANSLSPETPFKGVASYSKILSVVDPLRYAIYDTRVAVALNAVQLLAGQHIAVFRYPQSQNRNINMFKKLYPERRLVTLGFGALPADVIYPTYLEVLAALRTSTLSLLQVEMQLFADAERLVQMVIERGI